MDKILSRAKIPENKIHKLLNIKVDDSDVFLTGYPKSGTTWAQEIIWLIVNDLDYCGAKKPLEERFPFLEYSISVANNVNFQNKDIEVPPYLFDSIKYFENSAKPRFTKTHIPWTYLPEQIQNGSKRPKIVHVTRDPRDVAISFFHFVAPRIDYPITLEEFCKSFVTPQCEYWKIVLSYWEHRSEENVLFIKYEDMKSDLSGVIRRLMKFFDKDFSDDEITTLVEHVTFDNMKNNEAVNRENLYKINKKLGVIKNTTKHMRSGLVGEHKRVLSEEIREMFDKWIEENCGDVKFYCN